MNRHIIGSSKIGIRQKINTCVDETNKENEFVDEITRRNVGLQSKSI